MADVLNGTTVVTDSTAVVIESIADVRADIGQAKSDIRESVGQHAQHLQNRLGDAEGKITAQITGAERHLSKEVFDTRATVLNDGSLTRLNLANAERDLQNRIHETRLEALKTNTELSRYLSDKTDIVKEKMAAFERNVDGQFKDVQIQAEKNTRIITDRLDASERRALKDELDETRMELFNGKSANQFALQNQEIANLKQLLNSVEQTQKFSSKSVQFGTGNVAIPTQTANQG